MRQTREATYTIKKGERRAGGGRGGSFIMERPVCFQLSDRFIGSCVENHSAQVLCILVPGNQLILIDYNEP